MGSRRHFSSEAESTARAREIRDFVADLAARGASSGVDGADIARWQAWALGQADGLDLRVQQPAVLAAWVRGFELGMGA